MQFSKIAPDPFNCIYDFLMLSLTFPDYGEKDTFAPDSP